ncbi:MAG: NnrS family protein, partial [Chromatiales bacterium]|nr:NnrS family protein [Chromatiales bacterium]
MIESDDTVYAYGFRPFFLLAAGYAIFSVAFWSLGMTGFIPLPVTGDVVAWHIHELLFGFAAAALAGFLLTAVPEWTDIEHVEGKALQQCVVIWLLARIAAWSTALLGVWPMALLNVIFLVRVIGAVAPGLWSGAQGRHRVFLFLALALVSLQVSLYLFWIVEDMQQVRALLNGAIGLFMLLILAALGRISMVIVNESLDRSDNEDDRFLARPPRRNFAMGVMAMFLLVDYLLPFSSTSGWMALATAAAILNILNDWLLRGIWRDIYVRALTVVYLFMAAGFALIGLDNLWGIFPTNFARHALTVGAMGIAILAVLVIAGLRHTGRDLSTHPMIKGAFVALVLAALARVAPPWLGGEFTQP